MGGKAARLQGGTALPSYRRTATFPGSPTGQPIMPLDRRQFLAQVGTGAAALAAAGSTSRASASAAPAAVARASDELAAPSFRPLPLGAIRPRGWLERQLRIQAAGLSGHLDEFWPDVADSQWFGGKAEGWERAPYWLDGAIPLAFVLDDARLTAKVGERVEQILRAQRPDGWYAPVAATAGGSRPYDMWAVLLANKMMAQYHEATGDDRALRAVESSLRALAGGLAQQPLFHWGRYRWYEGLIPAFYVYERTGEPWLLDLARTLRTQGTDFPALFRGEDVTVPTPRRGRWTWDKHVVNTGMAPKAAALSWRLDQRADDRTFPHGMLALLDRYHGQVTGMFSGDECLAGRNPVQGTELCAVVEFLYSLEILTSVFGDPAFGDRLERVAFNALPATFTPDMWAHQYDQQVNQVQCTINPAHLWTTNGPESNLYGLEPNFGCCTSNMHQGWPKLTASLWMATPDGGLAAVAYAPCEVRSQAGGAPVTVQTETDYPFRDTITITVTAERGTRFPLLLRVPQWTDGATLQVAQEPAAALAPGTFHRLDREWRGRTTLTLRFPMRPRVTRRYHGALAVERGPLVYSLLLEEAWTRVNADKPHRELPHGDFEVRPASPWNYGLLLDPDASAPDITFTEAAVGEQPFSPQGAGMRATVEARRVVNWKLEHGWAGEIAPGPQRSDEPLEQVTLVPYGCTNIRVTEFPPLAG
jgi:uncharacterized protein